MKSTGRLLPHLGACTLDISLYNKDALDEEEEKELTTIDVPFFFQCGCFCGDDVANMQYRWTPLHLAAWNGHKELVEFLVKEGKANVNAVDEVSCLIIHTNHKS